MVKHPVLIIFKFTTIAENRHFINAAGPFPHNTPQYTLQPPLAATNSSSPHDSTPITQEVLKIIYGRNPHRSSGPSRINIVFLQLTAPLISQSLDTLFNLSLTAGAVPTIWKVAGVTPVFKKGDISDPGNYCPISAILWWEKRLSDLPSGGLVITSLLTIFLHHASLASGLHTQLSTS